MKKSVIQIYEKGAGCLFNYRKHLLPLLVILSLLFVSTAVFANDDDMTVKATVLNMRTGPGLTYDVIKQLKKNDSVTILERSGDWIEINHEGDKGWVASWLLDAKQTPSKKSVVAQVDDLNVRSGPSTSEAVITKMSTGDEAHVLSVSASWTQVTFKGKTGWVFNEYLTTIEQQETPTTTANEMNTFTVAVNALNVRKKPDLSSKKIGLLHQNESYPIIESKSNWLKIQLDAKKTGWVYSFHGFINVDTPNASSESKVTIVSNGTNIRQQPAISSKAIARANAGEQFAITAEQGDWYEIALPSSEKAFVAKWVVSTNEQQTPTTPVVQAREAGTLKGLTIVIDPGHGGNDGGTTGVRGTIEKDITLPTAELLATKLKQAGANVVLTRNSDTYVHLRKRVEISHQQQADAFVSLHFDASLNPAVSGFTTYYTNGNQHSLAQSINKQLGQTLAIQNRGAQQGNFFVLRENRQQAVLIELGFLTNSKEESTVTTNKFREQASHAIYNGLLQHFNE